MYGVFVKTVHCYFIRMLAKANTYTLTLVFRKPCVIDAIKRVHHTPVLALG